MNQGKLIKLKGISSTYKYFTDNIRCAQEGKIYPQENGRRIVELSFKQFLPQENKNCIYNIKYLEQKEEFLPIGIPVVLPSEIKAQSISPSGKKSITFRLVEKDFYLDYWSEEMLINSKKVTDELKMIYNDDFFGKIEWNGKENKCIFIGEKAQAKFEEFFDYSKNQSSNSNSQEKQEEADPKRKLLPIEKFEFNQDFGEACKDKKDPIIFILNCEDLTLKEINIDKQYYPSTPKFLQDDNDAICIGFVKEHIKLGIIYCLNRHTSLLYIKKLESNSPETIILVEGYCVIGPKVHPNSKKIFFFYLEKKMMAHNFCFSFASVDFPPNSNPQIQIVIPIVEECYNDPSKFQGIFSEHDMYNNKSEFIGPNLFLFSTEIHFFRKSYIVNIETKEIQELFSNETQKGYSINIISIKENSFIYCKSCIYSLPEYYLCTIDPLNSQVQSNKLICKNQLKNNSDIMNKVEEITKNISTKLFTYGEAEALLVSRMNVKGKEKILFFLHGGPHTNFNNEYAIGRFIYLFFGYSICLINYRGSVGYGQKFATSLVCKMGEFEIEDCTELIMKTINSTKDKPDIYLLGGSYGGFIGLKLIGEEKTSSIFKAAIIRNPVNNLFDMITTSDIPDWVSKECLSKDLDEPLNEQDICKLFSIIPTRKIQNVTTPLLLLLGNNDKRVSCITGLYYALLMKKYQKECKVLLFPEAGHGLFGAENELHFIVDSIFWLEEH